MASNRSSVAGFHPLLAVAAVSQAAVGAGFVEINHDKALLLNDRGQAELLPRGDVEGDGAERAGHGAALAEDVGAEAGEVLDP
jgi:hypothetical protein